MAQNFDFNLALTDLIKLVEEKLNATNNDHHFDWLADFPAKAKHRLERGDEQFKMPKTPARKKTRKQKKRLLNEDDGEQQNEMPQKKGKISNEKDELRESIGGRPRRQASNAAKSKIQHSLKMECLNFKLRRPSDKEDQTDNNASVQESDARHQAVTEEPSSPVLPKPRTARHGASVKTETHSPPSPKVSVSKEESTKVQFAPEPTTHWRVAAAEVELVEPPEEEPTPVATVAKPAASVVEAISNDPPKRLRPGRKPKKVAESEKPSDPPKENAPAEKEVEVVSVVNDDKEPVSSVRPTIKKDEPEPAVKEKSTKSKGKNGRAPSPEELLVEQIFNQRMQESEEGDNPLSSTVVIESAAVPAQTKDAAVVEDKGSKPVSRKKKSDEMVGDSDKETDAANALGADVVPKKKVRKIMKPTGEKPSAPSPRPSRNQKVQEQSQSAAASPLRRNQLDQATKSSQFVSPSSSPMRKMFTPKLVFSPFKPSSVKTKVEAFEAVLQSPKPRASKSKPTGAVLPEARVLLRRLTDQDLKGAGVEPESTAPPGENVADEKNLKRGTFVKESEPAEDQSKEAVRKSISQVLARKSVDKAKHLALSASRSKLQNDTAESPNVHLNRNAANMLSKFRFTNTSCSSAGSSSSSSTRHVAMTSASKIPSNVATGVSTFPGVKPMQPLVVKPTEEEEAKRKDLELRRLKEKEEEAARKREEIIKAKAEEQKRKHEARAKKAMEARALRAKQVEQEQMQKLENKEEKCNTLKMKLITENQEKAERARMALLQKQQEAEKRRKEEEEQKRREKEEEQQRVLAAKKEQEELERQAKLRQAEADKAKAAAAASAAAGAAAAASAASSKLNTTVTVTVPTLSNQSYHITPVRVNKLGKRVPNPDNYDIYDMRSDDSTDDDSRPKKVIPNWARSANVKLALAEQAKRLSAGEVVVEELFPESILLQDPDLNIIFKHKRARFDKRTSSAVWRTPPSKYV